MGGSGRRGGVMMDAASAGLGVADESSVGQSEAD